MKTIVLKKANYFFYILIYISISINSYSQIRVVNMVPLLQSNQTSHDVEPNIAVNPANRLQIAGTAFTPDPMGGTEAPIYISTDGGNNWALNSIIPGNDATYGTGDITARFAGSSNQLYAGTLRGGAPSFTLNLMRIPNFTSGAIADLLVTRSDVDQPYVQATTVLSNSGAGKDRTYTTSNERSGSLPAGVDLSLDAFSTPTPGGLGSNLMPTRAGTLRVMPGVRPTVHPSGVVYMAYYENTASPGGMVYTCDVVVTRDDNWGSGATPFRNLTDSGDGLNGQRVVTARAVPAFGANIGNSRLVASNISIAVDPTNAARVYVAWADRVAAADYTLHVRRSDDSGQTWTADLLTITNATNPALAVNSSGKLGFLYQQLTGVGASRRWVTHIQRSITNGTSWATDNILSTALMSDPGPWLGDYVHLMAVDKDFYGIFSASNYPDNANFPQGVTYNRNADWGTHQLLGTDGTTVISSSMDPFFFHITELASGDDFYVRDFTNSTTTFDPGLEPSTYPWFYVNSDVWNRRTNAPGGFNANDQPQSEDPWQVIDGINYSFARVHRKAVGPDRDVTLNYMYSEFGTGSNYVDASANPDPVLTFSGGALTVTQTTGFEWELPATVSNHTCLAVEISTATDPIIQPTLLGHAPGWSNGTDLMVLNDNNKAQRNMQVYRVPEGGSSGLSAYAVIHNPSINTADMILEWRPINPRHKIVPTFEAFGDKKLSRITKNGVVLANMKPGESRHIKVNYGVRGSLDKETYAIAMSEVKREVVVNGFSIGQKINKVESVIEQNVSYEANILKRISKLHKSENADNIIKNNTKFIANKRYTVEEVKSLYKLNNEDNYTILKKLLDKNSSDPYALMTSWTKFQGLINTIKTADLLIAQLSHLNALDAYITSLELEKGNPADYIQTLYIQKDLAEKLIKDKSLQKIEYLLSASNKIIESAEGRKTTIKEYPQHIREVLPVLKAIAEKYNNSSEVVNAIETLGKGNEDYADIQKNHINLLLAIRDSIMKAK